MKTNQELEEIFQATLEKWGAEAQYDQMIEECAELIIALKHYRRGKIDREAVVDELADVTLMLGQLTWMFGPPIVEQSIQRKLEKLSELMDHPS